MPRCTVIPVLSYPNLDQAIDWLCGTFGFTLRLKIGNHRAQLNVGDGAVALTQRDSGDKTDTADSLMVRVEDVHRHHEHARSRGARIVQPPADHPYGERQYTVEDFAGRRWTFSQSIADVAPEQWGGSPGQL